MTQRDLFPRFSDSPTTTAPAPAQRHSQTSVAAAESITPHLNRLERMVMDFLAKAEDGGTDEEIALGTGLLEGTARARRVNLVGAGKVTDSGRERSTSRGRNAHVWVKANVNH